ncbi:3291_t:CDS:1 [Cetraspora pellucida]|uniref:3291_t:CDS:1 n=1 Tax=Cetraspora pellucida TaxID=1433469 RepID=A0A9N9ILH4_9GLOM|nr:3291_t:CDS:1 [Cetraspora pellucida]
MSSLNTINFFNLIKKINDTIINKEKRIILLNNVKNQINLTKQEYDESRYYEPIMKGVIKYGNDLEIEDYELKKHDTVYREYTDDDIKCISQLNLIFKMCDDIENDKTINQEIHYDENHELFFKEVNRILVNPSDEEKEFLNIKKKEMEYDLMKNNENDHKMLKEKFNELPDYLFKRLILIYEHYHRHNTSNEFKNWVYQFANIFLSDFLIETYFNIKSSIFLNNVSLEDISLIILMTKIGFDYRLFKEYEIYTSEYEII